MQPSGPSTVHDPAGPQVRRRLARLVMVAVLALAMLELPVLVAPGARAASIPTDLPLAAPASHPEVPQLPAPTGPYRVGTLTMHLVDRSRPDPLVPTKPVRELMVQLWYPSRHTRGYPSAPFLPTEAARQLAAVLGPPIELLAAVQTSGREGAPLARGRRRYPVVLYSPGLGFPRALGTTLVQDLASHGFVVVAIDHTYDAAVVEFPGGRVERGIEPDPLLALRARVDDVGFVLGELARINAGHVLPGFRHRLNLGRVGMVGHSLGCAAATTAPPPPMPSRPDCPSGLASTWTAASGHRPAIPAWSSNVPSCSLAPKATTATPTPPGRRSGPICTAGGASCRSTAPATTTSPTSGCCWTSWVWTSTCCSRAALGPSGPPGRSRYSRPTSGRSSPNTCAVDTSGCSTARRAGSQR